jgi:AraC family transcriptional regulator of arabinose operon
MKFLVDNISEPLTLELISEKANLNKTYFITLFKKLNGVTPWEYITARRIEKSFDLLRRVDMNILEIANTCGFNNASNFNRAFRKVTGLSPSEYRKRNP